MERYKDNPVDLKVLRQRMNQKCRDSAPRPVKNIIAFGNRDGEDGFGEGGHNQDDFSEWFLVLLWQLNNVVMHRNLYYFIMNNLIDPSSSTK